MEAASPAWNIPGVRNQAVVDERWRGMKGEIDRIGRQQFEAVVAGGSELMTPSGDLLPPITLQAPRDDSRIPPLEPDPLDVFLYWPPPPPEYEDQRRPVLLMLHGASASKDEQGLSVLGVDTWFLDRLPKELVVLIPHCPSRARRPWLTASVKATLVFAVEQAIENGADPDRCYVSGLSMGGIGTWELALDAAEGLAPFAAAVPVCGMVMNTHRLPALVDYPLWVFHGANDTVNPCIHDDEAVAAILEAGGNGGGESTLHYTRYEQSPGEGAYEGHACWEQAYADEELWPWLLRQRRDPQRFGPRRTTLASGKQLPGGVRQGEVDEGWWRVQEAIGPMRSIQYKLALEGSKDLAVPGRDPVPPIRLQGVRDSSRKPPLDPDPLDFYFIWPPAPDGFQEKRPALLFLHGASSAQDEASTAALADQCFWLAHCPQELVVIIPHIMFRKQHWLLRSVKATLLYAVEKAVKLGVDPGRVYVSGLSMGGTAAWEFALSSVEGKMPFAAAVPVTPYVMSIKRASLLVDFPMWLFYGSNEWESLVSRVDDAVATALEAGANGRQEANLCATKYAWAPDTYDNQLNSLRNQGHGTFYLAYAHPELWGWLLRHRRATNGEEALLE